MQLSLVAFLTNSSSFYKSRRRDGPFSMTTTSKVLLATPPPFCLIKVVIYDYCLKGRHEQFSFLSLKSSHLICLAGFKFRGG